MAALLRMLFYSFEIMISKNILKNISAVHYLAKKYYIGIAAFLIYFLYSIENVYVDSIWLLLIAAILVVISQVTAFKSLKLLNSSTYVLLKQTNMIFLLIIGIFFNYNITLLKMLATVSIIIGTTLIIKQEKDDSSEVKNTIMGIVLCLATVIFSVLNVYVLDYALKYNSFDANTYTLVIIASIMITYVIWNKFEGNSTREQLDWKTFLAIQVTGILSFLIVLTKAISYENVGYFLSEIIYSFSPVFILIVLTLLKVEKINFRKIVGTIFGVIGVCIALFTR